MYYATLYDMWNTARLEGKLPKEWQDAAVFLHWATEVGYKVEYGFKGDFCKKALLAAIPQSGQSNVIDLTDAEALVGAMKLDELKALAAEMQIDLGEAKTKKQIAELIVAAAADELSDNDNPGDDEGDDEGGEADG